MAFRELRLVGEIPGQKDLVTTGRGPGLQVTPQLWGEPVLGERPASRWLGEPGLRRAASRERRERQLAQLSR